MKTKLIAIVGASILALGIGTAAYAAEVGPGTFRDMLPFMKDMHPNLNDSELEQMYNSCHQQGRTYGDQGRNDGHMPRMMDNNRMHGNSMMNQYR